MSSPYKALLFSLGSISLASTLAFGQANSGSSSAQKRSGQGSSASHGTSQTLSAADRQFMQHAATGGMMEVALGQIASEKASDAEVKAFSQLMVTDHTRANSELQALAQQKGVTLPAETADANRKKLSGLSGEPFDRAYIALMKADHQKDVAEFEKMSRSASDPDVKAWAAKTLPTLQAHRDKVKALARGAGGKMSNKMSNKGGSGTGSTAGNGNNRDSSFNANKAGSGSGSANSGASANGSGSSSQQSGRSGGGQSGSTAPGGR